VKKHLIKWLLRQRTVQLWLLYVAKPNATRADVQWTQDDARALEGFLHTGTGRKLLQELENAKADADTHAILNCQPATAYGHNTFARGLRAAVAKLKQLSSVRTDPDTTEENQASLPDDLEHLSDT